MAWLLIRGLMREQSHWGEFISLMCKQYPGEPVFALDIPGCGKRNSEKSLMTISRVVDDMRAQLRQAGYRGKIKLFGLSMGGMIAIDWMYAYPNEVEAVVLVNTSMRGYNRLFQRFKKGAISRFASLPFVSPYEKERIILGLVSNDALKRRVQLPDWQRIAIESPVTVGNTLRQMLAAYRFELPKIKPETSTLVLCSQYDHLVDSACGKTLAREWGSSLRVHDKAGHDLIIDDPRWVLETIKSCGF